MKSEGGPCVHAWYGVWFCKGAFPSGTELHQIENWLNIDHLCFQWCTNPKNSVILTSRSSPGTLARQLIAHQGDRDRYVIILIFKDYLRWWSKTIGNAVWSTFEANIIPENCHHWLKIFKISEFSLMVIFAGWSLWRWGGESSWRGQSWKIIARKRRWSKTCQKQKSKWCIGWYHIQFFYTLLATLHCPLWALAVPELKFTGGRLRAP